MTRKYVPGGTSQRSFLSVESLEDRSVPSTTSLDALGVHWPAPIPEIHPPAAITPALLDVAPLAITPAANGPVGLVESLANSIPAVLPVGNLSAGIDTGTLDPVASSDPVKDISLIVPLPELVAVLPPLVTPLLEPVAPILSPPATPPTDPPAPVAPVVPLVTPLLELVAPILSPLLPPPATPPADPPPPIAPLPVPPLAVAPVLEPIVPVLEYVAPLLPPVAPPLTPPSDTPPPGVPPPIAPLPVLVPVAVVTETVAQLLPPVAPLLEPVPPPPDAPPASTPPPIVSLPAPPPIVAPVPDPVAPPLPPVLLPPGAPPPPAITPPPVVPATHVPPPREHSEAPAGPAAPQVGSVAPPTEIAPPPPFSPRGEAAMLHNKSEGLPALHGATLAAAEANNSTPASESVPRQSSNPVPDAPQGLSGTAGAYRLTSLGDDAESGDPFDLPAPAGGMVLEGEVPNAEPVSPGHHWRTHTEPSQEPELADSGAAEMLESAPLPDLGGLEAFLAGLDRLGLPAGEGMRGWLLATALAAMACEVARRQMRTPRNGRQSAEDVAETLSWSLTLSGCS